MGYPIELIDFVAYVLVVDDFKTLWFTRCPVPTATGIAADRGWFDDRFGPDGITVRSLQDLRAGAPAGAGQAPEQRPGLADTHYTHELPTLIREGGNVPALWAASRGEPTRLIGLTWIEEHQRILTRPDVDLSDPGRLRELRLAIPVHQVQIDFWRAMALSGFAGALALSGTALDHARLVEIPADPELGQWGSELQALAGGVVDAVYVKGAVAVAAAERFGAITAINLDQIPDRRLRVNNGTPRPITVHQRLVDEHPEIVTGFLEVLDRAADWARDNPDQLSRILASETGSAAAGVAAAYRHSDLHPELSEERLDLLAQQAAFLHQQGFLARPVDVYDWALVLDKTGELV